MAWSRRFGMQKNTRWQKDDSLDLNSQGALAKRDFADNPITEARKQPFFNCLA